MLGLLTEWKERILGMFENRMMKRVLRSKTKDVIGGWRK
jgi:hypothetical protein